MHPVALVGIPTAENSSLFHGAEKAAGKIRDAIASGLRNDFADLESIDPSDAPGVRHHDAEGPSSREVINPNQDLPAGSLSGAEVDR